jgi:hypothetical protein
MNTSIIPNKIHSRIHYKSNNKMENNVRIKASVKNEPE